MVAVAPVCVLAEAKRISKRAREIVVAGSASTSCLTVEIRTDGGGKTKAARSPDADAHPSCSSELASPHPTAADYSDSEGDDNMRGHPNWDVLAAWHEYQIDQENDSCMQDSNSDQMESAGECGQGVAPGIIAPPPVNTPAVSINVG